MHKFLNQTIEVIAPASTIDLDVLLKIQSLNCFNLHIPNKIALLNAVSDACRFDLLKEALFNGSEIIWCLRGGYGSGRLMDHLMAIKEPPEKQKIFIGYSDVTAIHLFLSQSWGWKTIHGAMLTEILDPSKNPENFKKISNLIADLISKKEAHASLNDLSPLNHAAQSIEKIAGPLTGGNLSIIQTSLGTNWAIETKGKILFLEDVCEPGYKVDRMLNHCKQADILNDLKAIVFGYFSKPVDPFLNSTLERFARGTNVPVFQSKQFGHGDVNYPLIYNAHSEIISNQEDTNFSLKLCARTA